MASIIPPCKASRAEFGTVLRAEPMVNTKQAGQGRTRGAFRGGVQGGGAPPRKTQRDQPSEHCEQGRKLALGGGSSKNSYRARCSR
eukprot:9815403-Alexandrium_andersonii.AAC.1